jgi:hypothetical protein
MKGCGVFVVAILVSLAVTSGCFIPGSPGVQPTPSPAPTASEPLTIHLNATPPRYNPAMSSTIGIRLTPVNTSGVIPPDARFTWETTFGSFYHWGPPDFKVVELAPKYTGSADPVYWSYFSETGTKYRLPVNITLSVTDPSTGKTLASATLHVGWENPPGYTSVVENPE